MELLGSPRARARSEWVTFAADKRYRLLAYLAYRGDRTDREELGSLFWPNTSTRNAKRNLRSLLQRVKKLALPVALEIEPGHVRWRVETDVTAFREAVARGDLAAALERYRGPLLAGLDSYDDDGFARWLTLERERLRSLWRSAALQRAATLRDRAEFAAAGEVLESLLGENALEFDEEALRACMQVHARAGRRERALRVYRDFAHELRSELGVEPTSESERVFRAILRGRIVPPPRPPSRAPGFRTSLPTAATSFVGREAESKEIARRLARPDCRLLTLLGPGGVGKTRLAQRVAHELADRYDVVAFAPLESVAEAGALAGAVADALGVALLGRGDPLGQLARAIGDARLLLVLDNHEHLLAGASLGPALLERCPGLDLLVTSRTRLAVDEEWLLPIGGLPFPRESPGRPDDALAFGAIDLFVQRAQRVDPDFTLDAETLPHVVAICRLVEGLALALELAAVWVRAVPVADLAGEIERNLDILASDARHAHDRHRSIRATFEHTWTSLASAEREALTRLAVFRGGFTREAARVVADTPLAVLASLIDRSLLRTAPGGRYDRHPLLRAYCRERLAQRGELKAATEAKHAAYFFGRLHELWGRGAVGGIDYGAVFAAIDPDAENMRAAWRWAIDRSDARRLARGYRFADYLATRGRATEGAALCAGALAVLDPDDPSHRRALGRLLERRAWFYLWRGDLRASREAARAALHHLRGVDDPYPAARAHNDLAVAEGLSGDFEGAKTRLENAYAAARARGVDVAEALLHNLAFFETCVGNYARADALYRSAMKPLDESERAGALAARAALERKRARPRRALELAAEAVALAREHAALADLPNALAELALARLELGDVAAATTAAEAAWARARATGIRLDAVATTLVLGRVELAAGRAASAGERLRGGLADALGMRVLPLVMEAFLFGAEWHLAAGERERAEAWLGWLARQRTAERWVRDRARRRLAETASVPAPLEPHG